MQKIFFIISICFVSGTAMCQQKDTLISKLDSLSKRTDSAGKQSNNTTKDAYNENTKLTFRTYFTLLGSNLKQDFTKPFHMKKSEWAKFGIFTASIGVISFADKPIQKWALKFRNNNPTGVKVSKYITNFGGLYEAYTLAALGSYGFVFKNEKLKNTTLLATQSYITGGVIEAVVKFLTGRTRPNFYDPLSQAYPKFTGPFGNTSRDYAGVRSNSSFPSGHSTVAFAAATVFAMEYKSTIWVPIFSYSVASLIGISRITENKHWTTDVLVGAALGYLSGRQIVNNYHRYAKIKQPNILKNKVSFNMQYNYDHFEPGMTYTFRQ